MIKYTETKLGITKDGHTMFRFDIVKDLNRKSYLEDLTVEQQQEIAELRLTIHRMKHTLEVIASNPGWNDHHCRAMKILEEYSEHFKAKGK